MVGVPVETYDERLTTVTADRVLMERTMRAQARRRVVDKVAAAVMLQTWLDARPEPTTDGGRGPRRPVRRGARSGTHDPWDDPDVADALVVERPRRSHRAVKWLVVLRRCRAVAGCSSPVASACGTSARSTRGRSGAVAACFTVTADDTLDTTSASACRTQGLIANAGVFRWYVDHHGGLDA